MHRYLIALALLTVVLRPAGSSRLRTGTRRTAGTSARPNRNDRRPPRAAHWHGPPCLNSGAVCAQCERAKPHAEREGAPKPVVARTTSARNRVLNPSRQQRNQELSFGHDSRPAISFEADVNLRRTSHAILHPITRGGRNTWPLLCRGVAVVYQGSHTYHWPAHVAHFCR
jgi:hypothetical protein